MATVSDLKRRMAATARWMMVLEDGLDGRPHSLGLGEADAFEKTLAKLGVTFISKSKAAKLKLELRRGAKPVVRRYYGSPISDWHDLFVEEQFKPIAPMQQGKSTTQNGSRKDKGPKIP